MRKYKMTKREILENEPVVLKFPYCSLQYILGGQNPILYTSSKWGWVQDGYRLPNGWLLSTGYSPVEKHDKELEAEIQKITEKLVNADKEVREKGLSYEEVNELFYKIFEED